MENLKICYNPFTKEFLTGYSLHSDILYDNGKNKEYDTFIRARINNNILYLRTYYPYMPFPENITELNNKSKNLLSMFYCDILNILKEKYNFTPKDVVFNVENDLLKNLKLTDI